jgi:hypothetical protein
VAGTFFALAAVAPLRAIRDYDYFWHLATGRWIFEHRRLPRFDPFGAATDAVPWINGEWLFQALIYPLHLLAGHHGIVVARGLLIGGLFTLILVRVHREMESAGLALGLVAICWYRAVPGLSERPAAFAAAFVVAAVWMSLTQPSWRRVIAYSLMTVVWINFHPSALLAPAIPAAAAAGRLFTPEGRRPDRLIQGASQSLAAFAALLVNPYGIEGILAPNRLVAWVTTGPFVNREWQPSWPTTFTLLYLFMVLAIAIFLTDRNKRVHAAHALLLLFFFALAVRFIRNQILFFTVYPLLVAPMIPRIGSLVVRRAAGAAAIVAMLAVLLSQEIRSGVDERILPVNSTERLVASGVRGNVFTDGRYGGYLIWRFYPERRVVNDNRNELHKALLTEYAEVRRDSRAWSRFLEKYEVTAAVAIYEPPIPVVTAGTRQVVLTPASQVFYPRDKWALIARDEAAMIFVRRDAPHGIDLKRWEVPEPETP